MKTAVLWFILTITALSIGQTAAQTAGDPASGRRIAQQWCVRCHSLSPGTSGDTAPSFADLSQYPRKTEDELRNWLMRPHAPMPDYNLSRDDINDIIAFLHTLEKY